MVLALALEKGALLVDVQVSFLNKKGMRFITSDCRKRY
jgi:hypothetical protein